MRWLTLMELLGRLRGRLGRRLAPILQAEGLSGTEMLVLWKVEKKGPWRVTDLAGSLGIPFSTFTSVLDRLVARGFLERTPDPSDRRSTLVQSTPALHALLERVAENIERELDAALAGLSEEDYRRAIEALTTLVSCLDSEEGKRHGET